MPPDRRVRLSCVVWAAVLLLTASGASAQPLPQIVPINAWGVNGTVRAVTRQGDTLYVGGEFDYTGPRTGPIAVVGIEGSEPSTGAGVGGFIEDLQPVGDHFIAAGNLFLPDGTSRDLVRLGADGRVDSSWFVDVDGAVDALGSDGATVFIGGRFNSINSLSRTSLAAVDSVTGAVQAWNPVLALAIRTPSVSRVLVHAGMVFIAGDFTSVNGEPRTGFAAIDATTGATLPLELLDLERATAMAAYADTLYVAGYRPSFNLGGIAVSISTGTLLPWAVTPDTPPVDLVATSQRVYLATRLSVRGHDPITGSTIGPPLISNVLVDCIGANDRIVAIATNDFGGYRVRTFDASTGAPRAWSITADERVATLELTSDSLAIGGSFVSSAGGVSRRNLAAISLRTGRPTNFAPQVESSIEALTMVGSVLVVGGRLFRVDGQDRHGLAAIDTVTGALLPWAPLESGYVSGLSVLGSTLYVGGDFEVVEGLSRPHLAAFQLPGGNVTSWLPVPDGNVLDLEATPDGPIVAGDFRAMAAAPRRGIAAFVPGSNALAPWDPEVNGAVVDVAPIAAAVAMAGYFDAVRGERRPGFAVVDSSGRPLRLTLPVERQSPRRGGTR